MRDDGHNEKTLRVENKKQRYLNLNMNHGIIKVLLLSKRPGPFSLPLLRRWSKINAGASKYKVWKVGQSEEHAIPLNDVISQISPIKWEKN